MHHEPDKIPVVYVLDNFIRGGGTENQLAVLIDNLDRARFIPYVFNLRPKWKDIEIDCEVRYLNVTRLFSFAAVKAVFTMARFLKDRRVRILQLYFFDSRLLGTLAGRLARVETIVFCRREMGWLVTPNMARVFRYLARRSHYCLVNANRIKEMVMATEGFPGDRIAVIHNGIVLRTEEDSTPFDKRYFGIPETSPVVCMVANFRPVKRIDRLLRASAMLDNKDVHVVLIGEGSLETDLRKLAGELGIGERVHFVHTVNGVFQILRFCDIGVLTSESEGLSNVLIEYTWSGLPAVAFDVGGNNEVIIDGQTGFLVPPGDEVALAEKMAFLLNNPSDAARMGEAARERAKSEFDVKAMTRKTEDFYIRILENRPPKEVGEIFARKD